MRSATKQEVLAAADWCAQYSARWHDDLNDAPGKGIWTRVDAVHDEAQRTPLVALVVLRSVPNQLPDFRGCGFWREWNIASSILYAAALEGGEMPSGWEVTE